MPIWTIKIATISLQISVSSRCVFHVLSLTFICKKGVKVSHFGCKEINKLIHWNRCTPTDKKKKNLNQLEVKQKAKGHSGRIHLISG